MKNICMHLQVNKMLVFTDTTFGVCDHYNFLKRFWTIRDNAVFFLINFAYVFQIQTVKQQQYLVQQNLQQTW